MPISIINDTTNNDILYPKIDGNEMGHGYDEEQALRALANAPRPSMQHLFGDAPGQLKIIPRSEWDARYEEQEALQSSLEHVRMRGNFGKIIPSLDQNGQGYSHSEDTEVLTDKGWRKWPEWNRVDQLASVNMNTGMMEYQSPSEWHAYEYDDEMYYCNNRRLDFGVTRNHRMAVRKWDESRRTLSQEYSFQRADELGWYVGMMHAPKGHLGTELITLTPEGDGREYIGDDFVALISLIVSDGYASGSVSDLDAVSFCCFDERYQMVSELARRVGFDEQSSRPGVWVRRHSGFANWVRQHCYTGNGLHAQNKKIPQIIKCSSMRQIKLFLDWYGDKSMGSEGVQLWTASKRLADDLQEIYLHISKRVHIGLRAARSAKFSGNKSGVINSGPCYTLTVSDTDKLCIDRKKHIETESYKGLVYCATVPNGTLVTRRNGSVLISGNCWAYSTTAAVMMLRALSNLPYVRLSGHAVGCQVKNYRDEGGWNGLSADWVMKHGVPSVDFWKEKSMSRSNDTPEMRANALSHLVSEDWSDQSVSVYDRNLTEEQRATLLFNNIPYMADRNWWSHSTLDIRWCRIERGSWGPKTLNSWTDSWEDNGMSIIQGSRSRTDGASALRVTGASNN